MKTPKIWTYQHIQEKETFFFTQAQKLIIPLSEADNPD